MRPTPDKPSNTGDGLDMVNNSTKGIKQMDKFSSLFMGRPIGDNPREKGRIELYAKTLNTINFILVGRDYFEYGDGAA